MNRWTDALLTIYQRICIRSLPIDLEYKLFRFTRHLHRDRVRVSASDGHFGGVCVFNLAFNPTACESQENAIAAICCKKEEIKSVTTWI